MDENKMNEELEEVPVFTLTDEETGEEEDFELLAEAVIEDKKYYALRLCLYSLFVPERTCK